ncbi:mediator of RNA polymerase II transcription subunit 16 [Aspergillus campestris IBT 28561]|uniref:Mediator of RNA polymerase II transcription subunit 16 n=1 Tax=Aspergillus campestris (strain IBT 28561) TaxID=1392248 RepID=A0A2I1DCJ2_ASPC2|nr:mediator of RNA polymerase II transcription subunit 16 [Aspergillus campestris IBT 28561]PKY07581.1 mediator of RNA polymerase II transcription subunit 16 [Aspergillus campestris IBT 28561]
MPLMMEDDGINMEDLFGQTGSFDMPPPSHPPNKALSHRVDEMRLSGCCQKLAWSRQGCVAYVSADATKVNLRYLHCQPVDGKWDLSDDNPSTLPMETSPGHVVVHLSWNELGSDLAVVESSGRVSIFSIGIALNSVNAYRPAVDPDDDSAQVVGMMWLNSQRSVHAFNQAAKVQGRWAYSPFRRRPIGPFSPVHKSALVCVTKSGIIRLIYQSPDSRWGEISAELKNTSYSDRLLTHAALSSTQGGVLLVTHSVCQKIGFYRVHINWTPPQYDPAQLKQAPVQFPAPTFRFSHVKVETPGGVPGPLHGDHDRSDHLCPIPSALYCLTRLDIILAAQDNAAGSTTNPWIVAIYSIPPHAASGLPQQSRPSTVIVRWQLDQAPHGLHPKFDEVASKKGPVQSKPKSILRRLEDIQTDRYPISVDPTEYGNVVTVTFDDGSVAFYDPKTMSPFSGVDDANTVTSLAQAGFHYPLEPACGLHIDFSPSGCLAATLNGDGQVQLRGMQHSYGVENEGYDENKFSAAVAALTLAFSRGCGSEVNTDDIIMLARRQLSPDAQVALVNEVYRALPINCDYTQEHEKQEKLMSNTYIPRCLSLQAALGFKDQFTSRSLASAIPWAILQIRHAAILYPFLFQYSKGVQGEPHDPDVLRTVLGNTRWALDFSHYLLNELFELADELEGVASDPETLSQKLKSTASLPLIILLSSMSRAYLRIICRGLRGIYTGYANAAFTGDSRIYYTEIRQTLDASPVRVDVYEKFVAGIDSAVRHAYHGAGFGDAERPGPEKELLVNARIPPVLVTAVGTIVRQTLGVIKPEVDRLAIYMADYSWREREREVDVVRKMPLRITSSTAAASTAASSGSQGNNGGGVGATQQQNQQQQQQQQQPPRRRRCVRCCGLSDGSTPLRTGPIGYRLIHRLGYVRQCVCGGLWALEAEPVVG